MNRPGQFAIVLSCIGIGFALGRVTAPSPISAERASSFEPAGPNDGVEERTPTLRERSEPSLTSGERPSTRSAATRSASPAPTKEVAARPGDQTDEPSEDQLEDLSASVETLDPERARELVASLEEALATGDSEWLRELQGPLTAQAELVVPELTMLLEDAESLFARENLARLLGSARDPRALPALQSLLAVEKNAEVRSAAISALGEIPDPSSVPLLAAEFSRASDSPMPPSLAATALGKIQTPEAVAALKKEVAGGSNRMVQAFALRALAETKDLELVPFFLEQARRSDTNERSRRTAIEAVGEAGDANAIRELEPIARSVDEPQGIREAAKRAINKLAGQTIYEIR